MFCATKVGAICESIICKGAINRLFHTVNSNDVTSKRESVINLSIDSSCVKGRNACTGPCAKRGNKVKRMTLIIL